MALNYHQHRTPPTLIAIVFAIVLPLFLSLVLAMWAGYQIDYHSDR